MKPASIRSLSGGSQLNGCRPVSRTRLGWRGTHSSGVLRAEGGRRVSAAAGKGSIGTAMRGARVGSEGARAIARHRQFRILGVCAPLIALVDRNDVTLRKFVRQGVTLGRPGPWGRPAELWLGLGVRHVSGRRLGFDRETGRKSESLFSGEIRGGKIQTNPCAGRNPGRLLDRRQPRARPDERRCVGWCWKA